MARDRTGFRWTKAEWMRLLVEALPVAAATGKRLASVVYEVQRQALPEARQKPLKKIGTSIGAEAVRAHIAAIGQMSQQERERIAASKPLTERVLRTTLHRGKEGRTTVYWTQKEYTLLARELDRMVAAGDTRPMYMQLFEAQGRVLDEHRQRPYDGIRSSIQSGAIAVGLEEGRMIASMLQEQELAHALMEVAAPMPEPVLEMVVHDPAPSIAAPVAAAAAPVPEPVVPAAQPVQPSAAAQAFGNAVMSALDDLLRAHAGALMQRVQLEMAAQAGRTAEIIRAAVEQGMAAVVHKAIEAELGPMSTPDAEKRPEAPPGPLAGPSEDVPSFTELAAIAAPIADSIGQERRTPLRVDVIGLVGENCTRVRDAVSEYADVRFIDVDQLNAYAPHSGRAVIQCVKWSPHKLNAKLKAVNMQPIRIPTGASGAVIRAIEAMKEM